jgi:3'-phosphoadenosine 5'-phosphosulfate sulfotransferase (PAPS reductase)/FAD synthetase
MKSQIDTTRFRLLAKQVVYRSRQHAAERWLDLRLSDSCYVSWSAGKDSMVAASLCNRLRPEIPILMVDPGVPIHWTQDDRVRMLNYAREQNWNVRQFTWNKFANERAVSAQNEADYRAAVHAEQFAELTVHAEAHGLTRRVTGIRMTESKTRRLFLASTRGETAHTLQPLWNWTTEDVWTYTVANGLPWLSIYDHLGPNARNGLIGKNGREHGRLVYLKRYYPEAFKHACELFGARDYV